MLTPISKMVRDSRVAQSLPSESCFIPESLRWSSEGRPWLSPCRCGVTGMRGQLRCRVRREGTHSHGAVSDPNHHLRIWWGCRGSKETKQNPPKEQKEIQERVA